MRKNKKKVKIDFFSDGMRIFLNYILRQYKKNKDYKPHPIIRAFELALQGIEKCEVGKNVIGMSQDGTENNIHQPYMVVLQKKKKGIEVKEIRNLLVNKEVPLDIIIIVFRLQIKLDKISGETVDPQQMVNSLNSVIPGNRFFALGDRWKEARDIFREKIINKQIILHRSIGGYKYMEELAKIKFDASWEEYSPELRSFIGPFIKEKLENKNVLMIITSPSKSQIEKYKVFDHAIEFMIGKSSEYTRPFEKQEK